MVSSMQQILPIVWNTLTESAALYPLQCHLCISCFLAPSNRLKSICFGAEGTLLTSRFDFLLGILQTDRSFAVTCDLLFI